MKQYIEGETKYDQVHVLLKHFKISWQRAH
jgi:hypothetical protein